MPELGTRLPDDVLERRAALPAKPSPVTLTGAGIELVPLHLDRHVEPLHAASDGRPCRRGERGTGPYDPDALIWRYMPGGPFADARALAAYLGELVAAPDGLSLCVTDRASGQPLGAVSYQANVPQHLKIELGNIWYSPVAQGTAARDPAWFRLLDGEWPAARDRVRAVLYGY